MYMYNTRSLLQHVTICNVRSLSASPRYLLISVDDVARMHILSGLQELVHNIALVDVFQDATSFDHIVKVCVW